MRTEQKRRDSPYHHVLDSSCERLGDVAGMSLLKPADMQVRTTRPRKVHATGSHVR